MDYLIRSSCTAFIIVAIATNIGAQKTTDNKNGQCIFPLTRNKTLKASKDKDASPTLTIKFDKESFTCYNCSNKVQTLIPNSSKQRFRSKDQLCQLKCNGIMCKGEKSCRQADSLNDSKENLQLKCIGSRLSYQPTPAPNKLQPTQGPLIAGFCVGGIMLAVVIAGVILGRSRSGVSPNESDVATTPVSMSYSEWISNNSNGGRGAKGSNLRVQETVGLQDDMDHPPVPVYSIVYEDNNNTYEAVQQYHDNEATIIEVDELDELDGFDDNEFFSMKNNNRNIRQSFSSYKNMDFDESPHGTLTLTDYQTPSVEDRFGGFPNKLETNNNKINTCNQIWGDCYDNGEVYQMFSNSFVTSDATESESIASLHNARNSACWSDDDSRSKMFPEHRQSHVSSEKSQDSAESYERHRSNSFLNFSGISQKYNVKLANLTHVFVDVHRDMSSSCDDMRRSNHFDKLSDEEEVIEAINNFNKRLSLLTPEEDALHWWELRTLKRKFKSHNDNVDATSKRSNKNKKRERRFSV